MMMFGAFTFFLAVILLVVEVDGLDGKGPAIRCAFSLEAFGKASLTKQLSDSILFVFDLIVFSDDLEDVGRGGGGLVFAHVWMLGRGSKSKR